MSLPLFDMLRPSTVQSITKYTDLVEYTSIRATIPKDKLYSAYNLYYYCEGSVYNHRLEKRLTQPVKWLNTLDLDLEGLIFYYSQGIVYPLRYKQPHQEGRFFKLVTSILKLPIEDLKKFSIKLNENSFNSHVSQLAAQLSLGTLKDNWVIFVLPHLPFKFHPRLKDVSLIISKNFKCCEFTIIKETANTDVLTSNQDSRTLCLLDVKVPSEDLGIEYTFPLHVPKNCIGENNRITFWQDDQQKRYLSNLIKL